MSTAEPLTATSAYRDHSSRLTVLGAFQILLGCFCGLLAAFMGATRFLPVMREAQRGGPPFFLQAMAFYFVLAVAFIWLGKGTMAARRWAWTLTVVSSWMWLIFGALGFVTSVFIVGPSTWAYTAEQGKIPAQMFLAVRVMTGVFLACFYLGLPSLFLVLTQHESVRATCVRRDPRIPWTDRCPMPVLVLALTLAFSISSMLSLAVFRFVVPMFGAFISGTAGAIAVALIAVILAYLAWGTYHLRMAAWWGTLLFGIAGSLSTAITFARADLAEMYRQQGFSADQVEMFQKMGLLEMMPRWGLWGGLTGGAVWVVYLLAVRRYFVKGGSLTTAASPVQA
jgi:hypothetical protein